MSKKGRLELDTLSNIHDEHRLKDFIYILILDFAYVYRC